MFKLKTFIFVIFSVIVLLINNNSLAQDDKVYLQNLDRQCFRCLCMAATECDLTRNCEKGYCGPYKIGKLYWKDAGQVTLPDDDVERAGAYEDCAISFQCAQKLVTNYLIKYGRDCNNDGVTDCDDYSMINFNGGYQCHPPLNKSEPGRLWLQRYKNCNPDSKL